MEQYIKCEDLGDGAFGIVAKYRHKVSGEYFAIKKLKQRFSSFEECCQMKEIKSLRIMKHENVVQLHQFFRLEEHLYMVFELLNGSLYKTMKEHDGPFSEPEIRYIISQVLKGLAYVHKCGFFHRDMKPENLLWGGDLLKIADFGLAREIRSRPPYTEYISTRWYRAPEIVLRHEFYNSPVDIWAVGAIMAELYTLKPLFQGSSETDQLFKICSVLGTPNQNNWPDGAILAGRLNIRLPQFVSTPLASILPSASPEAIDLLSSILQYDPSLRPSASKALKHPFFSGPMQPIRKTPIYVMSASKAEKVSSESKFLEDESVKVQISSNQTPKFTSTNNRRVIVENDIDIDKTIDEILDDLL